MLIKLYHCVAHRIQVADVVAVRSVIHTRQMLSYNFCHSTTPQRRHSASQITLFISDNKVRNVYNYDKIV